MLEKNIVELRWYFSVIRHWLWLIVGCVLLGAASAFVVISWMPPVYSASATLLVNVTSGATTNDYSAISASERLVLTYSQMLTGHSVMEAVIQRLNLAETPEELAKKVTFMPVKDTQLIRLSVEDTDPVRAALIANTIADTFIIQIKGLKQTRQQGNVKVTLAEAAQVPKDPNRSTVLYMVLGALIGGMFALGMAFLLEYLDNTVKAADDVSGILVLNTLGAIGHLAKGEEELIVATQPLSPTAEAFRMLCTNIRFSSAGKSLRTLLITSPNPQEGKSLTVANLAAAMAQVGLSVIVVDADLRHPRLHQLFNLDPSAIATEENNSWGLTGSLLKGYTNGWLYTTPVDGVKFLPSGELSPNPIEMISSQSMHELLHNLAQQADVVLVDSPPALAVADVAVLAQEVDGVLLVLKAGHTSREAASRAVESLQQVEANLVGVVLNGVSVDKGSHYHYHYEYYHNSVKQYRYSPN